MEVKRIMRKITKQSVNKFFAGRPMKSGNMQTRTMSFDNAFGLYLHGNLVAKRRYDEITLYDCGWKTTTTKERLNGILEHLNLPKIYQRKGKWYRDGKEWISGEVITRNIVSERSETEST